MDEFAVWEDGAWMLLHQRLRDLADVVEAAGLGKLHRLMEGLILIGSPSPLGHSLRAH
jgi:hypothetical protein